MNDIKPHVELISSIDVSILDFINICNACTTSLIDYTFTWVCGLSSFSIVAILKITNYLSLVDLNSLNRNTFVYNFLLNNMFVLNTLESSVGDLFNFNFLPLAINFNKLSMDYNESIFNFFLNSSKFNLFLFDTLDIENKYTSYISYIDWLVVVFSISIILEMYYTVYNNSTAENLIDNEYLLACSALESEKEISSLDDIIMFIPWLVCLFGWYFLTHIWTSWGIRDLSFQFYILPLFILVTLGVPLSLLYYYGISFTAYLRGSANTSSLMFELLNDSIAILIYFTRISVQAVRLGLMLLVIASLNELSYKIALDNRFWVGNLSLIDGFSLCFTSVKDFNNFFLSILPNTLAFWLYEVLHLYFVVTIQFFSFFAIVFWLFSFLYTFFVNEKLENYFELLRGIFLIKKSKVNALKDKHNLVLNNTNISKFFI